MNFSAAPSALAIVSPVAARSSDQSQQPDTTANDVAGPTSTSTATVVGSAPPEPADATPVGITPSPAASPAVVVPAVVVPAVVVRTTAIAPTPLTSENPAMPNPANEQYGAQWLPHGPPDTMPASGLFGRQILVALDLDPAIVVTSTAGGEPWPESMAGPHQSVALGQRVADS